MWRQLLQQIVVDKVFHPILWRHVLDQLPSRQIELLRFFGLLPLFLLLPAAAALCLLSGESTHILQLHLDQLIDVVAVLLPESGLDLLPCQFDVVALREVLGLVSARQLLGELIVKVIEFENRFSRTNLILLCFFLFGGLLPNGFRRFFARILFLHSSSFFLLVFIVFLLELVVVGLYIVRYFVRFYFIIFNPLSPVLDHLLHLCCASEIVEFVLHVDHCLLIQSIVELLRHLALLFCIL